MSAPLVLVLPVPPSTNRYWRTRVIKSKQTGQHMAMTYPSADGVLFKKEVARIASVAGIISQIPGRVEVAYRYYPNRPQDWATRQRKLGPSWDDGCMALDLDNVQKALLDALKGVVFDDDKWVRKITAERMEPDERGARLVVFVRKIEAATPQLGLV